VACHVLSFHSQGVFLQITLQHLDGARFVAEARQHRLTVDQPAEDGATDQGMTPAEVLLTSLGGCVGQYVAQYLRLRSLPAKGLQVRVEADRRSRPLRLKNFRIEIVAPGLTERQLRALEKSLSSGLVQAAICEANTLQVSVTGSHAEEVTP
jgi:putative redox protein